MPRPLLPDDRVHPAIRDQIANNHRDVIEEVEAALATHAVVVIGMKRNPYSRKACALLAARGTPFHYLEYGGYLSAWRPRTALKIWSGWPTFPMVFVNGVLVGGFTDLQALIDAGELDRLLTT